MRGDRLLIVAPSAYPMGGVATWLDYIIPGLEAAGWKVELGLTEGRFHDVDKYLETHPAGKVARIGNRTGTREGRVRQLCEVISASRPDVVAGVHIGDLPVAVDRLKRHGLSTRMAMITHSIEPE